MPAEIISRQVVIHVVPSQDALGIPGDVRGFDTHIAKLSKLQRCIDETANNPLSSGAPISHLKFFVYKGVHEMTFHIDGRHLCTGSVRLNGIHLETLVPCVLSSGSTLFGTPIWDWNEENEDGRSKCYCNKTHRVAIVGFTRPAPSPIPDSLGDITTLRHFDSLSKLSFVTAEPPLHVPRPMSQMSFENFTETIQPLWTETDSLASSSTDFFVRNTSVQNLVEDVVPRPVIADGEKLELRLNSSTTAIGIANGSPSRRRSRKTIGTVEDAIRRLILPDVTRIKAEQRKKELAPGMEQEPDTIDRTLPVAENTGAVVIKPGNNNPNMRLFLEGYRRGGLRREILLPRTQETPHYSLPMIIEESLSESGVVELGNDSSSPQQPWRRFRKKAPPGKSTWTGTIDPPSRTPKFRNSLSLVSEEPLSESVIRDVKFHTRETVSETEQKPDEINHTLPVAEDTGAVVRLQDRPRRLTPGRVEYRRMRDASTQTLFEAVDTGISLSPVIIPEDTPDPHSSISSPTESLMSFMYLAGVLCTLRSFSELHLHSQTPDPPEVDLSEYMMEVFLSASSVSGPEGDVS